MKSLRRFALMTVFAALCVAALGIPASASDDGVDAWDLYDGDATLTLGEPTLMWECWADAVGGRPRLYQRIGDSWRLLDVADTERDVAKCGSSKPIKAVYEFMITNPGLWNASKGYYEAQVLTKCYKCVSYKWKIPVVR